ncbi:hypothetical protein MKX03_008392 [Papaver bracteatum]|nr:hypothetical protein MKX03_008392 [Papaver bracteatum]
MRRVDFSSGVGDQKKKSGHIKNLPYDILLDILSRLPIESVSECKLVCKGWLKILLGRKSFFTNMHVTRQLNQHYGSASHGGKLDMGLLFGCTANDCDHVLLFYGGLYHDKINTDAVYEYKKTLKKVRHPLMHFKLPQQYLVNSCNGLVCLGRYHHECVDPIYIYNPTTGEYVNLPKQVVPKGSRFPRVARGFGYVPSTNEYKVVRIFYPDTGTSGQVQVYTLGSGCGWRTKCILIPWVFFESPASFAEGTLYWFNHTQIYAFDLANEELRIILSPCPTLELGTTVGDNFGLMVLRGKLCFFHQTVNAPYMEIWSLKKTDMNDSWCLDFSIVYEKKEKFHVDYFWPIIITRDNKIIFMREFKTLECYDTKTTAWTEMVAEDPGICHEDFTVVSHVNTFVSLRSLGEKSEKKSCRNKMFGQLSSM